MKSFCENIFRIWITNAQIYLYWERLKAVWDSIHTNEEIETMKENMSNIIWNPNDKFQKINFTSNTHNQKDIKLNKTKKIIESTFKNFKVKGRTRDSILVQFIFTLGLKTLEIRLLRFEDESKQDVPKIKVSNNNKWRSKWTEISGLL